MLRAMIVCLLLLSTAIPASAAGPSERSTTPIEDALAGAAHASPEAALPAWAVDRPERRPAPLPVLYGAYGALQAMDVVSTRKALSAGATEQNPLMTSSATTQIAIKAAAGAATIYFAERTWKKNRAGAIVLMAVLNGATAAIVARNAQHARR